MVAGLQKVCVVPHSTVQKLVNVYHDHTGAPVSWRSRSGVREGGARFLI